MTTIIIDSSAPKPYSHHGLQRGSIGGTEATVVRVAEKLDWLVLQHNRLNVEGRYRPISERVKPSAVIVLRDSRVALESAVRFPGAKIYLWMHDLHRPNSAASRLLKNSWPMLKENRVTLIAVSDYHANQLRRIVSPARTDDGFVRRIYNPVVVPQLASCPVDIDKLIYFSSPNKALRYTLKVFRYLRQDIPSLKLFVANPGYITGPSLKDEEGVVDLGPLPHAKVLSHVKNSLCTFYPNYRYPETFGLVLAESNAVGTPVLTHPIGAAPEVLSDRSQFVEIPRARSFLDRVERRVPGVQPALDGVANMLGVNRNYLQTIRAWRGGGRPNVHVHEQFDLDEVCKAWKNLLATQ